MRDFLAVQQLRPRASAAEGASTRGTSPAVQQLRPRASAAEGASALPGGGTKIPHAAWWSQKKRKSQIFHLDAGQTGATSFRDAVGELPEA